MGLVMKYCHENATTFNTNYRVRFPANLQMTIVYTRSFSNSELNIHRYLKMSKENNVFVYLITSGLKKSLLFVFGNRK